MLGRLTVVIAALVLAAAAAAAADPVPLSERTNSAHPVGLAFDGAGRAVASWRAWTPSDQWERHVFAVADAGGHWRSPVTLPATVRWHELAVSGHTAVLVTARQKAVGHNLSNSSIRATMVDTRSGRIRDVVTLDKGPPRPPGYEGPVPTVLVPRVAATPDGGALVAWTRTFPRKRRGIWVAQMRPSGHFGRSHRLVLGGFPLLAIGPDGRGVLAWADGVRIVAKVRHANGTWGPVEHVATHRQTLGSGIDTIDVAASRRRLAVGIVETVRSAAGVRLLPSVHVRVGRGDWRGRRLADFMFMTDATTAYVAVEPRVLPVVTTDGALHAAWPALADGHIRVMAGRIVTRGGSLAVANTEALSPATTHARVEDIAAGPSGALAVAWLDASYGTTTPGVAEVNAAGVPHATIGFAGESASIDTQVAYNPRSARPTVLWSEGSTLGFRPFAWTIPAS